MSGFRVCPASPFRRRFHALVLAVLSSVAILQSSHAQLISPHAWTPVGPAGGDARAFAAVPGHPDHVFLGTLDSWVYESLDRGASWHRVAKLDAADDLVLDSMLVDASDPSTIYVAAWKINSPDSGGGLWISHDSGKTWKDSPGLRGQSIRSFAQAPSNPKMLYAGSLEGIFLSADSGATWKLISPPGSKEIHKVESLAIDPANPDIIYAGTWHLPWKTSDGGQHWQNIKQGVIEDSDVFSIIVDPVKKDTVFLSACSGIYKSDNAGDLFHKVQGIPSDARRTRVLMQDPNNHDIVYAGTTQGLYKTTDAGKTFKPLTAADVIVNDVYVDPADSNKLLLATDRGGVLSSTDAGVTFKASNEGISERKVDALMVDRSDPTRLYAGVVNDKLFGGAFVSTDGGQAWQQIGQGLEGRDVFALAQAADGTIAAGTSHGIFVLAQSPTPHWEPRNVVANTILKPVIKTVAGKRVATEKKVAVPTIELASRVNALDLNGDAWLASTALGLFTSADKGATWQGGAVMNSGDYLSVAASGSTMAAARSDGVVYSLDAGKTWAPMQVPTQLTRLHRVAYSPDGTLWLGAREGVYFTRDNGQSWLWIERLPFRDVDDLTYDANAKRIVVSSRGSDQIYAIDPITMTWKWWQTGYSINLVRVAGDRIVVASLFNGVLVEPKAVSSAEAKSAGVVLTGQK